MAQRNKTDPAITAKRAANDVEVLRYDTEVLTFLER
jgi:hypothetical protein